ncbi:MAG TPA: glycine--tRNA ligase [Candidatus Hodarchaeales archaeon]|nr:glycine--tRNA ligase [Candidatus Hodarchaeales archaeon]
MSSEKVLRQFIDKISAFASKTGIAFTAGEIYGGLAGFWDFGHNGVEIKNRIKTAWWNEFVRFRDDIFGFDGAIITHPKVWEASGHATGFDDPLIFCEGKCKKKLRLDHLLEESLGIHPENLKIEEMAALANEKGVRCPDCNGPLGKPVKFNLMLKTQVGAVQDTSAVAYLRPENAQSIFAGFKNTIDSTRVKMPFGIAQIGKVFRNEISPRNFLFRVREFELMEFEFFTDPEKKDDCPLFSEIAETEIHIYSRAEQMESFDGDYRTITVQEAWSQNIFKNKWQEYWITTFFLWFNKLGIRKQNMRFRQHLEKELSFYALDTWDIEYRYSFGWKELMGVANRTQYDLLQHQKYSNVKMEFQEQTEGGLRRYVPYVAAEPSVGVERILLAILAEGYSEETVKDRQRTVLRISPSLAPYDVAIFPLQKDEKLLEKTKAVFKRLRKSGFVVYYDDGGSIGKRYRRQDEIGTPFCVTFDYDSLGDNSVTVRDRDSMEQTRVSIDKIEDEIRRRREDFQVD